MRLSSPVFKAAAAAAILLAASTAQADIATYNSQSTYLGAVGSTGIDTFDDLVTDAFAAPLNRAAGAFAYTATISGGTGFGGSDDDIDMWLTSGNVDDTITFGNFGTGVAGAGGNFFGSDRFGFSQAIGQITVSATDSTGATVTQVINAPGPDSFVGFVSTTYLTSLSVSIGGTADGWPAVNNLHLSAPVPEPATYGMLLAGLGLLGCAARRRKPGALRSEP
ncbi:MAG TPA: PEP-CTERM sorting domain-containing protein [Pseudoduganella sp.]